MNLCDEDPIDAHPYSTTILGYNFSAPLFISPAAAPGAVGGYVPENGELGLLKGAYTGDILYIPAMYAGMTPAEMASARNGTDQVTFQQVCPSLDLGWSLMISSSMRRTIALSIKNS